MYADLHVHTEYTENKGISKIDDLIKKALGFDMKYLGIADSGNISGVLEFYTKCIENDIKPIIGCGFYYTFLSRHEKEKSKNHIVLIAENNKGLKNIAKLVKLSYKEGFYKKPRIDKELLEKYSNDVVMLSGGLGGPIDKKIISGNIELDDSFHHIKEEKANKVLSYFIDIMGRDNLYLEIQDNGKEKNIVATEGLLTLAGRRAINTITSGGSFYVEKEELKKCNDIRLKNSHNTLKGDYHFKSEKEMHDSVIIPDDAIINSGDLAKKVDINLDLEKVREVIASKDYKKKENKVDHQKRAELILDILK